jgi:methanethiol oxidase
MTSWKPDQTFYPSPKMAMQAKPETTAFVAMLDPTRTTPDALAIVDVEPTSRTYGQMVGRVDMPNCGDELHHFGWNACSSCLCPYSPHPHTERRYLVVPGMRSSRIHVIDTKPDPRQPKIVKVIQPETVIGRTGYSRPHTAHCGPDGIYFNALGSPEGEGPGGIFIMDPETFEVRGRWEPSERNCSSGMIPRRRRYRDAGRRRRLACGRPSRPSQRGQPGST